MRRQDTGQQHPAPAFRSAANDLATAAVSSSVRVVCAAAAFTTTQSAPARDSVARSPNPPIERADPSRSWQSGRMPPPPGRRRRHAGRPRAGRQPPRRAAAPARRHHAGQHVAGPAVAMPGLGGMTNVRPVGVASPFGALQNDIHRSLSQNRPPPQRSPELVDRHPGNRAISPGCGVIIRPDRPAEQPAVLRHSATRRHRHERNRRTSTRRGQTQASLSAQPRATRSSPGPLQRAVDAADDTRPRLSSGSVITPVPSKRRWAAARRVASVTRPGRIARRHPGRTPRQSSLPSRHNRHASEVALCESASRFDYSRSCSGVSRST